MGEFLQEGGSGFSALQHQTAYAYDGVNRLGAAQATAVAPGTSSYSQSYYYDAYGNMCWTTGCIVAQYPSTTTNHNVGYTYDAAGNVISDGAFNYQWNAEGKLTKVTGANGFSASYAYDAQGQRITATVTTQGISVGYVYVYDAFGKEYAEINTTQSKVDYNNFWLGDRIFAKYDQANGTVFLHPSDIGSTTMTTGPGNGTIGAEIFYPFGQSWGSAGTLEEERFAKFQQRDIGTGLDYTLNRMYPSWQGRWLTPDPGGKNVVHLDDPQTWNMYEYAHNNPTTVTDPSGLMGISPEGANLAGEGGGGPLAQAGDFGGVWLDQFSNDVIDWGAGSSADPGGEKAQNHPHHHKPPKPKTKPLPSSGPASTPIHSRESRLRTAKHSIRVGIRPHFFPKAAGTQ